MRIRLREMRLCLSCAVAFDSNSWTCPHCGFCPVVADGVPTFAPDIARGNQADATYAYDELHAAEGRHFWFISRSRLIAWAIRRYFPDARSLFDVGCGTGGVLTALRSALPRVRFAAADALLAGLAFARRQLPDVAFAQVDIRRLPYDREFDLIGVFDVLEHLDDDEHALREMYRSTNVGGGLIVTVPQHPFLWSALDEHSRHRRRYTRRDMLATIERAGYTVLRATSFMTLTLPAQLASRLRKQSLAALDPTAEMRLNPVVDRVLGAVCSAERAMIACGVSFPAGGSLLVIARRMP
jgi:SAM-dependent methyltransferase